MAKRIYWIRPPREGKRAQIPPTSKVSVWLKKMKDEKILLETKKGYISNVNPLLREIESTLKDYNIELNSFEKHMVHRILDSQEFRSCTKKMKSPMGHYEGQIWISHDIDSAWEIMNLLASFVASVFIRKKGVLSTPFETPKDFDKKLSFLKKLEKTEEFRKLVQSARQELVDKARISDLFAKMLEEHISDYGGERELKWLNLLLNLLPDSTLQKLASLSTFNRLLVASKKS